MVYHIVEISAQSLVSSIFIHTGGYGAANLYSHRWKPLNDRTWYSDVTGRIQLTCSRTKIVYIVNLHDLCDI